MRMAKLENEIAVLGREVRELVRRRAGSLPDADKWVQVMVALADGHEIVPIAEARGPEGPQAVAERVQQMGIPPAAEPVRAGLLRAVEYGIAGDLACYREAVKALRAALEALLATRGAKWQQDMSAAFRRVDLYRCALEWESYPEGERPAYIPPRRECTDVLVLAALALRCAAGEVGEREAEQEDCEAAKAGDGAAQGPTDH